MGVFIKHGPCPRCTERGNDREGNNLAIYSDNENCFACGYHKNYGDDTETEGKLLEQDVTSIEVYPLPTTKPRPVVDRGIATSVVYKYKVTTTDEKYEAVFPVFGVDGRHVGNQFRYPNKAFKTQIEKGPDGRSVKTQLFGQPYFPSGGKAVTITEGYYDTLSVYQMTGSRFPALGVQSASSAYQEVVNNFEYLDSFQSITINFDNDEKGLEAAKKCAALFAPGKVKLLLLSKGKDASDYLQKGWDGDYVKEWHRAPPFMPDGIQLGNDPKLLEEIVAYRDPRCIFYPWEGLNKKLNGARTSELVLITAPTGVGKTSIMKEIEYTFLTHPDLVAEGVGVGFLHLEEPKRDLALGLLSVHKNKPYHLPEVEKTEEEIREAYAELLNNDRVVIWDHFGSNDIDVVLAKIRHMAALGCKYIMLDHLSIIVSDQSGGDERKQLDEISTKLKTLTINLDINVHAVIHVNRQGQIRGSAGPEQVANIIIRLERDLKDRDEWRRNITRVSVEKNRKYGRTGPASWLYYNEINGRLEELSEEDVNRYEEGGGVAGNEFDAFGAAPSF